MAERRHYFIRGTVQGVWFRAWTRETARELGLAGWVRNVHDGRVEAVAQGDADTLERFEELLWQGPPNARVTGVDRTPDHDGEPLKAFDIRY